MNKKLLSVPMVAAMMASCAGGDNDSASKRPNVIVILCDDLGYGDVSAYGSTTISTPNVDSLAHGGVCFNNAYATSATSTPSRYALMTGMYPWKNKRAKILNGDAPLIIDPEGYTLPKMMKNAGYVTGAIGKWHLGMGEGNVDWNSTIRPGAKEVGFDYSCVIAATVDRVPTVYIENGDVVGREADDPIFVDYVNKFDDEPNALDNPELVRMQWSNGHNQAVINGIPRIGYMKGGKKARWIDEDMADYFVDKVKNFLNDNKDKPFFLYYGLHQPHVPRTPNQRFVGATTMGPRGDAIAELDWCVGELIAELRKLDLLDNTIIVFTSDNGPVLDDGYADQAVELIGDHQVTGGLRGGKYSLYDGGAHIPFFVYWKNHIEPVSSHALVCQMDLLNSLAALVGQPVHPELDSKEMLDVFLGKSQTGRDELVLEAGGRLCYRKGDWALIPPYDGPKFFETEYGNLDDFGLFNLSADRGQQNNVAEQNPEKLEEMKSDMHKAVQNYYNAVK